MVVVRCTITNRDIDDDESCVIDALRRNEEDRMRSLYGPLLALVAAATAADDVCASSGPPWFSAAPAAKTYELERAGFDVCALCGGAERLGAVVDVDASHPTEDVAKEVLDAVRAHGVIIVKGQSLSRAEQVACGAAWIRRGGRWSYRAESRLGQIVQSSTCPCRPGRGSGGADRPIVESRRRRGRGADCPRVLGTLCRSDPPPGSPRRSGKSSCCRTRSRARTWSRAKRRGMTGRGGAAGAATSLSARLRCLRNHRLHPEIQRVTNFFANGTWKGPATKFGAYWRAARASTSRRGTGAAAARRIVRGRVAATPRRRRRSFADGSRSGSN